MVLHGFRYDRQLQLLNDQSRGAIWGLLRDIVLWLACHGLFRLLKCIFVDLVSGFLASQQLMAIDWSSPGCASWCSYRWETGEVHYMEECIHFVR